jgi:hypothetical protein
MEMEERGEKHLPPLNGKVDRRFSPTGSNSYDIKRVWAHHHEILRMVVLGKSNVEIAESLNITPQTVSNVRNSPLVADILKKLMHERDEETVNISKRIEEFTPVAVRLLEEVIAGNIPGASIALRAKYADRHLARTGYGVVTKVQSLHGTLSKDDIEDIKARAVRAAEDAGIIVESTYTDLSEG